MSYNDRDTYRSNDGLDDSSTTDAYGSGGRGATGGTRGNDGLATSNTSDNYSSGMGGSAGGIRSNDGLDSSNTTDSYGGMGSTRRNDEGFSGRDDEGLRSSGRTDQGLSSAGKYDRSAGGNYDDPSYGGMSHSQATCPNRPADTLQNEPPAV